MSFSAPPAGRASTYQAIYSTAFTAAGAIGPLLSGWVVTQPQGRGWFGAAAFFACAGVVAAASGAAVMRYRPRTRTDAQVADAAETIQPATRRCNPAQPTPDPH